MIIGHCELQLTVGGLVAADCAQAALVEGGIRGWDSWQTF